MPALDSKLRSQLDDVCQKARDVAVAAAESALKKRAVDVAEPFAHFGPKEKELRNRLRARGRQVGDVRNADKTQSIEQLTQELAYEFWHRMLFARFLAENNLLMHPDGVAVSLEECEELAKDADPPAPNGFVLAARYASTMLPQIFRTDDVLLEIDFAPEQRLALEKLLASLPKQTLEADDSLGWVYQFWQTAEKKRVNDTGDKIDGHTLPAVTQLFTEHYMVEFLLQNTIGAWWCGRHSIQGPPGGAGTPPGKSPVKMPYLRWRDDGAPAAGKFEGWPTSLAEFRMLDPCCGSGHFLVSAFNLLVPLRMHDEGLTAEQACEAVLRDNVFGLELDPRCTQIAAFALALAAWKYPEAGGFRSLPSLNIACSGQGVTGKREEWVALANGNERLHEGMDRLYDLFQQAPHLGSLIDPQAQSATIFSAGFQEVQPLLDRALRAERAKGNHDAAELGVAAKGISRATEMLAAGYTLVVTNVPYLGRYKQDTPIKDHCDKTCSMSRGNLATALLVRAISLCKKSCTAAAVTPQAWLLQGAYEDLRKDMLQKLALRFVARLGPRSFETISGEVVNVALVVMNREHVNNNIFAALDVTSEADPQSKASHLRLDEVESLSQKDQQLNPDSMIGFSPDKAVPLLNTFASAYQGLCTSDDPQFVFCFWEPGRISEKWRYLQTAAECDGIIGGCSYVLFWENGEGRYWTHAMALKREGRLGGWKSGGKAWGKKGIAVNVTSNQFVNIYTGEFFDNTVAAIIPNSPNHFAAIWRFLIRLRPLLLLTYPQRRQALECFPTVETSFLNAA